MMKPKRIYLPTALVLSALLCVGNVDAQPAVPADSLSHYLQLAALNNPSLRADFLSYQAALQKLPQAGAYPDPQLEMGLFTRPMDIVGGREVATFKLMQMFPWFGIKPAARTEAMHRAQMVYQQFRARRDNLYLAVSTQWYRLCSLQQQIADTRAGRALLDKLEALAANRLSAGRSMTDVLRIELETNADDDRIESLLSDLRAECAAFNALLNREAEAEVVLPDSLTQLPFVLDEAAALRAIEQRSPLLEQITEEEQTYRAQLTANRRRGYPTLGIGLQYMLNEKTANPGFAMGSMNGDDMLMPMLSVTIPLYRNKYKAAQRESDFLRQAARRRYDNTVNTLGARLYTVRRQLDDAARRIALCRKQAALTETIYRLALQEFAVDRGDLTTLIGLQRQLLDYRRQQAEATADYNTAVADVRRLTSSDIDNEQP
jgi:outer membrane protein TolC